MSQTGVVERTTHAQPAPAAVKQPEKPRKRSGLPKKLIWLVVLLLVAGGGFIAWKILSKPPLPPGFAGGNGRLEAQELYVSTKYPGRIAEVLVDEGQTVDPGQIVGRMDTSALEAQLRQAEAQIREAQDNRSVALADITVKQADYAYADQQHRRSRELVQKGAVSEQESQIDTARMLATRAELVGSRARAVSTLSTIAAAQAEADRLRAEINDAVLVAPIRARVETRLAEPGEVLAAGGRVYSLVDLSDVYMYVFLPEREAGKIALGSEARIVLDAAPQYPVRTYVSFVSPMAQFTPKTVETAEERHNLTFRVKLQIPKDRLRQYEPLVKVGMPGMGYVRFDQKAAWPAELESKGAPPANMWQPTGQAGRAPDTRAAPK